MNLKELIKEVEKQEFDPTIGLPETLFEFATRITPMVNVDLLLEILRKKFAYLERWKLLFTRLYSWRNCASS